MDVPKNKDICKTWSQYTTYNINLSQVQYVLIFNVFLKMAGFASSVGVLTVGPLPCL